jgi:beta-lactamase class D
MTNTNTAIRNAVEPLRAEAIKRAREFAKAQVEFTFKDQSANPSRYTYPKSYELGRREYSAQLIRYKTFNSLIKYEGGIVRENSWKRHEPAV